MAQMTLQLTNSSIKSSIYQLVSLHKSVHCDMAITEVLLVCKAYNREKKLTENAALESMRKTF